MKKLETALLLILVAAQTTLAMPGPDEKADQILRMMHEKSRDLTAFQASVLQVKRSTQVPGRQRFTGHLYFKHQPPNRDKIRITYTSGGQVTNDLLIDGDKVILYQPKIKQAIVTSRSRLAHENPEYDFLAAPYGSAPGLKNRYTISYQGDETVGPFSTSVIQLVPVAKSSFTRVQFWVDRSSWFPAQYRVEEVNGDITTLTLSDIKKNSKVPRDAFNLELPKGTKILNQ